MYLPEIILALLILLVGWLLANTLKSVTIRLFKTAKLTEALDRAGMDTVAEKAGYPFKPAQLMGTLVKWFVLAVFFVVALDLLGLDQVTYFVRDVVLGYLPKVIVAALMLMAGVVVASLARGGIQGVAHTAGIANSTMFGNFAYYAIIVFVSLAALNQLQIVPAMTEILLMGVVFALSLAFGLAFGLGGRDAAAKFLAQVTKGDDS